MTGDIRTTIGRRQSFLIAGMSLVAVSGILTALLWTIVQYRTFIVWCQNFFLANVGGVGGFRITVIAAAVSLAAVTIVRAAWFVRTESMRRKRLYTDLRTRGTISSGKASSAASTVGVRVHVVNDTAHYAFVAGSFHPRVYVSRGMVSRLSLEELKAVMRHERHHAVHLHPLQSYVIALFSYALFFVPSFKDVRDHLALGREVQADSFAGGGCVQKRALASAISKAVYHATHETASVGVVHFGKLQARIHALAESDERVELHLRALRLVVSAAVVMMILLASVFTVVAAHAQGNGSAPVLQCPASEEVDITHVDVSPFLKLSLEGPMTRAVQSPYFVE